MSALAKLFAMQNYQVSGCDAVKSEETDALAYYGVKTYLGLDETRAELKRADLIVYTDAVGLDCTELVAARNMKKRILSRVELLRLVCENFPHTIAVAGSHGKTTCTAMCAHILKSVGVPFTAHIGGHDRAFGNFYYGGEEFFLTEACEYKRNFLKIPATRAVVLNIDYDHMECYDGIDDLTACFQSYALNAEFAFVCADDIRAEKLGDFVTFGIDTKTADYRAVDLRADGEKYAFTVEEYGKPLCRIKLQAIGRCNVYNALASFAVMRSFGFDEKSIKRGLENFRAIKRRFEKIGEYKGASFICDYAHHPKELLSTLITAERLCKGELYVVFQPHTYSRTRILMDEFITALKGVKNLMLYKTYAAREKYDESGSAKTLAERLGSLYCENMHVLQTWLKTTVKEGDAVLFLGAGDLYYIADYVLKELK